MINWVYNETGIVVESNPITGKFNTNQNSNNFIITDRVGPFLNIQIPNDPIENRTITISLIQNPFHCLVYEGCGTSSTNFNTIIFDNSSYTSGIHNLILVTPNTTTTIGGSWRFHRIQ